MEITFTTFLIVCPICFFAGILNASGGGGGLISLPAFLLAGLPPHAAIGTNKLHAVCGLAVANVRYIRSGLVNWKLAGPTVACSIAGSLAGSHLSLLCDETVLLHIMIFILPVVAVIVLKMETFAKEGTDELALTRRTYVSACLVSLAVGTFDGFYGPGSGTFYVIGLTAFSHMSLKRASAQAKVVNVATNVTAVIVFLLNGQVYVLLGLVAGACNMLGAWLGAGMVIKSGSKAMKPLLIVALVLLLVKLASEL